MKKEHYVPELLRFQLGNAKLPVTTLTLSMRAGYTCPGADKCFALVAKGKIKEKEKKEGHFRCFAASAEARHPSVYEAHLRNERLLKACTSQGEMEALIDASLKGEKRSWNKFRHGVSGDFYSDEEFRAWMNVARRRPSKVFYAYTKSLRVWVENKHYVPANFVLTASKGGKDDRLIAEHGLKYAEVVFSVEHAAKLGLEIDHDDSHAWRDSLPFALLLHGTQPKGSEAAKALSALKALGHKGYSKKR